MSNSSTSIPHAAIALQASNEEIDAELRKRGTFQYSHEYTKDIHFRRFVLEPQLSTMEQVHDLLQKLDDDHKARNFSFGAGCTKAYSARQSLKYTTTFLTDVEWALTALAKARRTNCGCHQTGSFHPQQ